MMNIMNIKQTMVQLVDYLEMSNDALLCICSTEKLDQTHNILAEKGEVTIFSLVCVVVMILVHSYKYPLKQTLFVIVVHFWHLSTKTMTQHLGNIVLV